MLRGALALLLLLAACERQPQSGVHATREQCERLVVAVKASVVAKNAEQAASPSNGFSRWDAFFPDDFLERCQERMTRRQLDCLIAHAADWPAAGTCKPEVDLRPADARRTPEECARYVEKVRTLAAAAPPDPKLPWPDRANAESHGAALECADWLSLARFNCTLAAQTDADRKACPR